MLSVNYGIATEKRFSEFVGNTLHRLAVLVIDFVGEAPKLLAVHSILLGSAGGHMAPDVLSLYRAAVASQI